MEPPARHRSLLAFVVPGTVLTMHPGMPGLLRELCPTFYQHLPSQLPDFQCICAVRPRAFMIGFGLWSFSAIAQAVLKDQGMKHQA